ncbi:hypothetical protein ACIBO2_33145 [Nonomuraea sp. NPDC050022]|uniref:hypothetical protein n=1 Tax=unclassified Nonomuraea TaxID=2593643 RepID=UPI0033DED435
MISIISWSVANNPRLTRWTAAVSFERSRTRSHLATAAQQADVELELADWAHATR